MMKSFSRRLASLNAPILFALVIISLLPVRSLAAPTQKREHLTPQEVEMVADTQELDKRIAVFIKIAERRLLAIANPSSAQAQSPKEVEKWGELPKGTRANLFYDLARTLDEAINNVDDVATRTPDSALLPKAVRKLAEASARFLLQLTPLRESATADGEREALEQAIDDLQQIIEAAKKLPEETPEKKRDKKNN